MSSARAEVDAASALAFYGTTLVPNFALALGLFVLTRFVGVYTVYAVVLLPALSAALAYYPRLRPKRPYGGLWIIQSVGGALVGPIQLVVNRGATPWRWAPHYAIGIALLIGALAWLGIGLAAVAAKLGWLTEP